MLHDRRALIANDSPMLVAALIAFWMMVAKLILQTPTAQHLLEVWHLSSGVAYEVVGWMTVGVVAIGIVLVWTIAPIIQRHNSRTGG